jgi:hypothetical protein
MVAEIDSRPKMRDRMNRQFLMLTTVALIAGCSHAPPYTGDGEFTDHGFMAYSRRYAIDLGPVDLSKPGTYIYSVSGLPRAEFVANIQVTEEDRNTWEKKRSYPAVVHIQLQNEQGRTVIDEKAPLDSWLRSFGVHDNLSELYRRGEVREIALPDGGTKGERVGLKASGGWGTHFYSEPGDKYKLSVTILESSMKQPARITMVGWER